MASYMLVRHKIPDFSVWKPGYDAHLPSRVEAGLTEAQAFAESADLRETMQKLGVLERPDIYFLND